MEQWEKEYIDIVTEAKKTGRRRKAVVCSHEEGYDSSGWIETTRPDGTKYYVPKDSAFKNRKSKRHAQSDVWNKRRGLLKICFRVAIITTLIWNIATANDMDGNSNSVLTNHTNNHSLQEFIQGRILGGTYINGQGFADMMRFFEDMQIERHSFLNDVASNINELSKVNEVYWSEVFKEREDKLIQLKYAESYEQYVAAEKRVFEQQTELLTLLKYNAEIHLVLELYYQLADSDLLLRNKAVQAMEKNGIKYSEDEDGLTYWYKQY